MRKTFTTAVLAASLLSAPAFADVYTFDFSAITSTTDLSLTSVGDTNVQFSYDNGGSAWGDTAYADAAGIYGSTYGSLMIQFATAIYGGLRIDYTINNVTAADIGDNAQIELFSGGTVVDTLYYDAGLFLPNPGSDNGTAIGTALIDLGGYTGGADTALIYFSPVAGQPIPPADDYNPYQFAVSDVTYGTYSSDSTDFTPEPGTWVLLVSGVIAIGFGSHKRKSVRV